jgi:hypothetical protein
MGRKKRSIEYASAAAVTVGAAVALGCHAAAVKAIDPVAESRSCSDVGTSLCPPDFVPQNDVKEPAPEWPAIQRNRTEQAPPLATMPYYGDDSEAFFGDDPETQELWVDAA